MPFLFAGCSPKTGGINRPLKSAEDINPIGEYTVPDKWWTVFEDSQLNTLIDSAVVNNYNLQTAWERLQESQAIMNRESSFLWPAVDGTLQAARNFPQPDFVGGENVRIGLAADYEIDLWGRIASRIDAEQFRAGASMTDYQAAVISLSAEIAGTWYRLMETSSQQTLLRDQIATNEQILELLEVRFGNGQVRSVDILRQRQLVEATREELASMESSTETLENQLAVLTGTPPQKPLPYDEIILPSLPQLPDTGITTELIQRRPDVQSAFLYLHAADRDLATAISSQYPRLSISASAFLRSNNFDNLIRDWAYSFAGNLFAPIFYGGRLKADVDRSEAVKNQRLYEYGQTVLTAFREVEDALLLERNQQQIIDRLENQLELVRKTYEQLRIEYFNGFSNYLDVLTALTEEQQLNRELLSAKRLLIEYRIGLYRALAGGFEPRQPNVD